MRNASNTGCSESWLTDHCHRRQWSKMRWCGPQLMLHPVPTAKTQARHDASAPVEADDQFTVSATRTGLAVQDHALSRGPSSSSSKSRLFAICMAHFGGQGVRHTCKAVCQAGVAGNFHTNEVACAVGTHPYLAYKRDANVALPGRLQGQHEHLRPRESRLLFLGGLARSPISSSIVMVSRRAQPQSATNTGQSELSEKGRLTCCGLSARNMPWAAPSPPPRAPHTCRRGQAADRHSGNKCWRHVLCSLS